MRAPGKPGTLTGLHLGQCQLLSLIAVGGTAEIYLARITGLASFRTYVVVKILHDHLVHDKENTSMFVEEAKLGAILHHPNVAKVIDLGFHEGTPFLVMEHVPGFSVTELTNKLTKRSEQLPTNIAVAIVKQACLGLTHAHTRMQNGKPLGIIHRDVSPQNLMISFNGLIKLVDFGIAKSANTKVHTKAGTVKGKFAYMSPEQCRGAGGVDHRSDIFSLGTVLYELTTSTRLFKRESAYDTYQAILEGNVDSPEAKFGIPRELSDIIMTALSYSPDKRIQQASIFAEALTGFADRANIDISRAALESYVERQHADSILSMQQLFKAVTQQYPVVHVEPPIEYSNPPRAAHNVTTSSNIRNTSAPPTDPLRARRVSAPETAPERPRASSIQPTTPLVDTQPEGPDTEPERPSVPGPPPSPDAKRTMMMTSASAHEAETIRPGEGLSTAEILQKYGAPAAATAQANTQFMQPPVVSNSEANTQFMQAPVVSASNAENATQFMQQPSVNQASTQYMQPPSGDNSTRILQSESPTAKELVLVQSAPHFAVEEKSQVGAALLTFFVSSVVSFIVAFAIGRFL